MMDKSLDFALNNGDTVIISAMVGGLGAQIFNYLFMLWLKDKRSDDSRYIIDTSSYYNRNVWNGYELNRIFGISEEDVFRCEISDCVKKRIVSGSIYREALLGEIALAFNRKDLSLYYKGKRSEYRDRIKPRKSDSLFTKLKWYLHFYLKNPVNNSDKYITEDILKRKGVLYFDEFNHTSCKYLCCDSKTIEKLFHFPPIVDENNLRLMERIQEGDRWVALHVRRSDHMYDNRHLFQNGFYKKAIKYVKGLEYGLHFLVFSDDIEWCKVNTKDLNIDLRKDDVIFVDWNIGKSAYIDMQIMTMCKYHIIPYSSFSVCGYLLSNRADRYAIAPKGWFPEFEAHL